MSIGASRGTRLFDAGNNDDSMSGILRSPDEGAATLTGIGGTGITLPLPLSSGTLLVCVEVSSVKTSVGNETYLISLFADEVIASNPVAIVSFPVAQPGSYQISVDLEQIRGLGLTKPVIFCGHTLAGTNPTISYGAWIVQESAR